MLGYLQTGDHIDNHRSFMLKVISCFIESHSVIYVNQIAQIISPENYLPLSHEVSLVNRYFAYGNWPFIILKHVGNVADVQLTCRILKR